jgi:riboflavin kinase / FMN adenylyltransferase
LQKEGDAGGDDPVKVYQGLETVNPPLTGTVLTIGNFDGVHRAHRQLLAQASLFAANTGGPVTVLTFEPHPLTIVGPERTPPRLATPEDKLRCLRDAGADIVVVARSEPKLLNLEPEDFVHKVIEDLFHPTHIVEGPSFGFGKGRRGDPEMLKRLAAEFGAEVHIVSPVTLQIDEGETLLVSSSLIRKLIGEGDVRRAALCLGEPYTVIGTVVEGDRRGRTLGFPTANLVPVDQLVPREGVYAGYACTENRRYLSAISIGTTPTFDGLDTRIEAYLLDFDGDLYGMTMRIGFERFLREQRKFSSTEALVDQLQRDVQAVRDTLEQGTANTHNGGANQL